jgi:alcohol dehydrogenase class IV
MADASAADPMTDASAADAMARRMAGFKDFYQYAAPTRVIAGRDLLGSTGFEFRKEGAGRVFVVTDGVIRGTGLVDGVAAGLEEGGLEVAGVFDEVPQDSSTDVVDRCAAAAREAGADSFLAVGGGSVMDTAKVADAVFTPAGTGSEVSMAAVIKDPETKVKLEMADFPLFPRLAILDPESTRTLPPRVAAATGMDAVTHAIESYVSTQWSPHQDARALHALRLIRDNVERAVATPDDEDARGNMLVAANLAIAIELGSVHAMSHSVGGLFGVPHGVANAIHLPHVIRFNGEGGPDIADRYRDIADVLDVDAGPDVGDALAEHVTELVGRLGLPTRLTEVGVPESALPQLVEGAMGDGTTLLNPREVGEEEYAALYRRAL